MSSGLQISSLIAVVSFKMHLAGTDCIPLLADIFSTHMKQNIYSLCSQLEVNSFYLGSSLSSHVGTLIMCPSV